MESFHGPSTRDSGDASRGARQLGAESSPEPVIYRSPADTRDNALALPIRKVGIREVVERIWLVSFMSYDLGVFDHQTGTTALADDQTSRRYVDRLLHRVHIV